MTLLRFAGAALLSLSAFGCAPQRAPAPALEKYLAHSVAIPGESLSLLAQWYTGDPRNWRALFIPAPAGELRRLKRGDQVLVPYHLLKNRAALTKEYVAAHRLPPAQAHRADKSMPKKANERSIAPVEEERSTPPVDELESEFLRQMVIVNDKERSSEPKSK